MQPTLDRDAELDKLKHHNPAIAEPFRDFTQETGGFTGQAADHTLTIKSLEAMWSLPCSSAANDLGFASYVSATGGFKRESNDIRGELTRSVNYGSTYYTFSYRPTSHIVENQYREIKISIKGHPDWTVLTKKGYYAMRFGGEKDVEHQFLDDISLPTFEPMPFNGVDDCNYSRSSAENQASALHRSRPCEWSAGLSRSRSRRCCRRTRHRCRELAERVRCET